MCIFIMQNYSLKFTWCSILITKVLSTHLITNEYDMLLAIEVLVERNWILEGENNDLLCLRFSLQMHHSG